MLLAQVSADRHWSGEQLMAADNERWQRYGTTPQQTSLAQQVVLGHLLPQVQAAQEWQTSAQVQHLRVRQAGARRRADEQVSGSWRWLHLGKPSAWRRHWHRCLPRVSPEAGCSGIG